MFNVDLRNINDIPYYIIEPKQDDIKGNVLLYHGWSSNAEKQCFRGKLIASFGYRVIVPEIVFHGVRGQCDYSDSKNIGLFLETLLQSIEESSMFINHILPNDGPKFVIGHSLGGMISLGSVMQNSYKLAGCVAMNSNANWPAYQQLMKSVFGDTAVKYVNEDFVQKLVTKLELYSPEKWNEVGIDLPTLLTNGAIDTIIPAGFNKEFCKNYPARNVKQVIFKNAGHVVTDGMLAEVENFLNQK